ncbi:ABC transporter substrate-binding protein [Saccharopolyspora sp. NPDC002376]
MSLFLNRPRRRLLRGAVTALALLTVMSCGSNGQEPTGTASGPQLEAFADVPKNEAVAALLPERVRQAGKLVVVMNVSSAPTKFFAEDNKTIIGLNPDLARAIGRVLGVEIAIENVPLDGIIPGLQANRYDFTIASMSPTEERLKTLDMIQYGTWGSSLAIKSGNPQQLSLENLCGFRVAVQQGSIQESKRLPELNQKSCLAQGRPALAPVIVPSQNDALLQLQSARVEAVLADSPVLAYAATQAPGTFELAGELNRSEVCIGLPKGADLTPAVQAALGELMKSTTYQRILDRWGMSGYAVPQPALSTGP